MIHPEGRRILLLLFLGLLILSLAGSWLFPGSWPWWILLSVVLLGLVGQFFRYPRKRLKERPEQPDLVFAPADGEVLVVEEVTESEYFRDQRVQVSIFMSLFNVHLNTAPVGGEVIYYKHHLGRYLAAYHPKSSSENERTSVVIRHASGEILVRQVAGVLARRIRNYFLLGQPLRQGQEIGFIRFGSRVDILLPKEADIQVSIGDKVRFNRTVLARLPAGHA